MNKEDQELIDEIKLKFKDLEIGSNQSFKGLKEEHEKVKNSQNLIKNMAKKINVKIALKHYAEKNPKKPTLNARGLAKRLGVTNQVLSDWDRGKTPKVITHVSEIERITGCSSKKFIVDENE